MTATRRDESILTVPLSVSAYDEESLDAQGIRSVADLARVTPGISVTPGFAGLTSLSIRGLTSTPGGSAMNGLYVNETPVQIRTLSLGSNFYPSVFDLERIEVLRGPQGTLFGAGAMGGAIRYITRQPSVEETSANLRAEAAFTEGGDPTYELGAAAGGPLVENVLAYRASAYERREGGYVDRMPYTGFGSAEENSNSRRVSVATLGLTFRPTDRLEIAPSLFYQETERDDTSEYWTLLTDPSRPRFLNGNGFASVADDTAILSSLTVSYDFDWATLISNTAWLDRETSSTDDGTAFILDLLGLPFSTTFGGLERSTIGLDYTQRAFTQEVRLQSDSRANSRSSYVLGLFYQDSRQEAHERDTSGLAPLFFGGASDLLYSVDDEVRDTQIAAFGQFDYRVTDNLTLTAGARVAEVEFDFINVVGGPFAGGGTGGDGETSETVVTPKFGVQYTFSADWMMYVSAAKGFRPGGANAPAPSSCAADLAALGVTDVNPTYESDSLWGYEAGVKGRAGERLTLAASVFDIEWTDMQRGRTLPTCGFLFQDNLGSARSVGFDAQVLVRPVEGLTFGLNVGYTDATFQETIRTEPLAATQGTLIQEGDRFAAPWLVSVSADYETPLGSAGFVGYARVQYDFRRGYDANPTNVGADVIEGQVHDTEFVSARLGLRMDRVDLSLFGDNLLDSDDLLNRQRVRATGTRLMEQTFRPRTIGVTASYRY